MKLFFVSRHTNVLYKLVVLLCVCVAQSTQNKQVCNIFAISQGNCEDEVDFLSADKHQRLFQIDTIILSVCDQASPNYPK